MGYVDGLLVAAHAVAGGYLLWLAVFRVRAGVGRRWLPSAGLAVVALGSLLAFGLTSRHAVPIDLLTPLQEGSGACTLERIHGSGAHAQPAFFAVMSFLMGDDDPDIRDHVRVNLWLTLVAATLMFGLVLEWVDRFGAAVAAVVLTFACSLALRAEFSGTPAALVWVQLLTGVVAIAVARDPAPALARARPVARALAVLAALMVVATRVELSVVVVPAVAVALLPAAQVGEAADALDLRLRGWVRAALRPRVVVGVVALGVVIEELVRAVEMPLWLKTGLAAVNLVAPSSFDLGAAVIGPWSWPILGVGAVGVLATLGRPVRWALLPWTLAALARVYGRAAHGSGYELQRYAAHVLPLLTLLVIEGWCVVERWSCERRWPAPWRWLALAFVCMSVRWPSVQGTSRAWLRDGAPGNRGEVMSVFPLNRAPQQEVRWLLRSVDAEPGCVFVAHVASNVDDGRWAWKAFGRPVGRVLTAPPETLTAQQAADSAAPGASCVRLYQGIDCALERGQAMCAEDARGLRRLAETHLDVAVYSDPDEYGDLSDTARLAIYDLRSVAEPPPSHAAIR